MHVVCSNTALHECVLRDNCRTTAVLFSGLKQDGTLDIWGIRADPNLRNSEGCVSTTYLPTYRPPARLGCTNLTSGLAVRVVP